MSNDNNKKPLVLFSGGLDSTFLLYNYLLKGDVHVCYVINAQHWDKPQVELEARRKLIPILEFETGNKVLSDTVIGIGTGVEIDRKHVSNQSTFVRNGDEVPDVAFGQAFRWLYALNMVTDGNIHSEVAIGYIMGDQIMGQIHNVRLAWDSTQCFTKMNPIRLVTPLQNFSKDAIYREIPKHLMKYIWVCDTPIDGNDGIVACGSCVSCATEMKTKWFWEHINSKKLSDAIKSSVDAVKKRIDAYRERVVSSGAEESVAVTTKASND